LAGTHEAAAAAGERVAEIRLDDLDTRTAQTDAAVTEATKRGGTKGAMETAGDQRKLRHRLSAEQEVAAKALAQRKSSMLTAIGETMRPSGGSSSSTLQPAAFRGLGCGRRKSQRWGTSSWPNNGKNGGRRRARPHKVGHHERPLGAQPLAKLDATGFAVNGGRQAAIGLLGQGEVANADRRVVLGVVGEPLQTEGHLLAQVGHGAKSAEELVIAGEVFADCSTVDRPTAVNLGKQVGEWFGHWFSPFLLSTEPAGRVDVEAQQRRNGGASFQAGERKRGPRCKRERRGDVLPTPRRPPKPTTKTKAWRELDHVRAISLLVEFSAWPHTRQD
jgi:hypothetical protein